MQLLRQVGQIIVDGLAVLGVRPQKTPDVVGPGHRVDGLPPLLQIERGQPGERGQQRRRRAQKQPAPAPPGKWFPHERRSQSQPGEEHQARHGQADEPFAHQCGAQRADEQQAISPASLPAMRQKRRERDGHEHRQGDVHHGALSMAPVLGRAGQHHRRQQGCVPVVPRRQQQPEQGRRPHSGQQRRGEARGEGVSSQDLDGKRLHPEIERRLFQKRFAIEPGHDPIPLRRHLGGDPRHPRLVARRERMHAQRGKVEEQEECQQQGQGSSGRPHCAGSGSVGHGCASCHNGASIVTERFGHPRLPG